MIVAHDEDDVGPVGRALGCDAGAEGKGIHVIAKAGIDHWLLTPTDDLDMGAV